MQKLTKSYSTPLEKLEDICFNLGNLHNGRGSLFDVAGNQQSKTEVKIAMFLEFPFFFLHVPVSVSLLRSPQTNVEILKSTLHLTDL